LVLPPGAPPPAPPPRDLSLYLAPAPIGEAEPPLQARALRNGGPAPLEYRLDLAPLAELTKSNYGFEVLRFMGGAPLAGGGSLVV
jgi:hypothetical protein